MIEKTKSQQARAEMFKSIRTLVRLKHMIAADRELYVVLLKADAKFTEMEHKGVLPAPADIRKALGL